MCANPVLTFSTADKTLAARLEAAEAANGMVMAESVRELLPESAYKPFAGGIALFTGIGSPMTHALGIGMRGVVPASEMEKLEQFFWQRGSACLIDLCPLADASVLTFVQQHEYRILEFNNVLARLISPDENFQPNQQVSLVSPAELAKWARMIAEAFSESFPVTQEMADLIAATCRGARCWVVDDWGHPAGGAAMAIQEEVALFFGDAVTLRSRCKGLHAQLISTRLGEAQRLGARLAMVSVLPGSASHRNFERLGFQLIYMRVNLARELGPV